jgi:hypothetical protein
MCTRLDTLSVSFKIFEAVYSAIPTYGLELAQLGRMPLGPNLDFVLPSSVK